jgi:hypothetical protein
MIVNNTQMIPIVVPQQAGQSILPPNALATAANPASIPGPAPAII